MYSDIEMRGARQMAKFVGALASDIGMTIHELTVATDIHRNTAQRWIKAMKDHKPKIVYIKLWEEDARGCKTLAAYALGDLPDMPKPKPRQKKVLNTESKRRRRALKTGGSIFSIGEALGQAEKVQAEKLAKLQAGLQKSRKAAACSADS